MVSSVEGAQAASREGSRGGTVPLARPLSKYFPACSTVSSQMSQIMWLYLLTLL